MANVDRRLFELRMVRFKHEKRSTSGVMTKDYGERVIASLKYPGCEGTSDLARRFKHFLKRSCFQLVNYPELNLYDVLVSPGKPDHAKGVRTSFEILLLCVRDNS